MSEFSEVKCHRYLHACLLSGLAFQGFSEGSSEARALDNALGAVHLSPAFTAGLYNATRAQR
jgi:hypothetical protein